MALRPRTSSASFVVISKADPFRNSNHFVGRAGHLGSEQGPGQQYVAARLNGWQEPTPRRLIHDHGGAAYGEARQRERDVILPDGTTHAGRTPAHWRRVALVVVAHRGSVGVDTATRMLVRGGE